MRIQLVLLSLFLSLNAVASEDSEMQELFKRYDLVMDQKKIEMIDEIFTERFIKSSGGKAELIEKIKGLSSPANKSMIPSTQMTWKKGRKENLYLASLKETSSNKSKRIITHTAEFIVIKESGKLKIDGTLGDAE